MKKEIIKGRIYKLVSKRFRKVYIGSTCDTLARRFALHKGNFKMHLKTNKGYCTSFELMKFDDVRIILLEEIECKTKRQLRELERKYILKIGLNKIVNKQMPARTVKEYLILYQILNRNKVNEYAKNYYRRNIKKVKCDCGKEVSDHYLEKHKLSSIHTRRLENNEKEKIENIKNQIINLISSKLKEDLLSYMGYVQESDLV